MPSFLERYRNGEREEVWSDLDSLGGAVRQAQYLPDAQAVAEETMKRVRHNVELLVERLDTLGYEFSSPGYSFSEQLQGVQASMDYMDRLLAGPPDSVSPQLQGMVENLRLQHEALREQGLAPREMLGVLQEMAAKQSQGSKARARATRAPGSTIADDIAEYENSIGGPIPLSLRAWCEIVGSVSLVGTHPTLCVGAKPGGPPIFINPDFTKDAEQRVAELRAAGVNTTTVLSHAPEPPLADPLAISCNFEEEDDDDTGERERPERELDGERNVRRLALGINDRIKAGARGRGDLYCIEVPSPGVADAAFGDWHKTSFVNYLRIAFRWGGFPGWERYSERPDIELAYLRHGLLPI